MDVEDVTYEDPGTELDANLLEDKLMEWESEAKVEPAFYKWLLDANANPTFEILDEKDLLSGKHDLLQLVEPLFRKLSGFEKVSTHIYAKWNRTKIGCEETFAVVNRRTLAHPKVELTRSKYFYNGTLNGKTANELVQLWNLSGMHCGHVNATVFYTGDQELYTQTFNLAHFCPQFGNFNCGVNVCKEKVIREIIQFYGSAIVHNQTIWTDSSKNVNNVHVPTHFINSIIVKSSADRIFRFSFLLEHEETWDLSAIHQSLVKLSEIESYGITDLLSRTPNSVNITKDNIHLLDFDYNKLVENSVTWTFNLPGYGQTKIPDGVMCCGTDYESGNTVSGTGIDFFRGPDGTFYCRKHCDSHRQ